MSVLTPKERELLAAWLESEAAIDGILIEQLEKLIEQLRETGKKP